MAAASAIGGIGYLYGLILSCPSIGISDSFHETLLRLLLVSTNVHVLYFATFCITSGTYTTIGLIIAWCMLPRISCRE